MKSRPILFSGPMVMAILAGSKTQTRRVMKQQPFGNKTDDEVRADMIKRGCMGADDSLTVLVNQARNAGFIDDSPPYGECGDQLWVKETHLPTAQGVMYRADLTDFDAAGIGALYGGWKSPIFCWQEYSRITLEIVSVRVERLKDISIEDAKAEGVWGPDESIVGHVEKHFGIDVFAVNPIKAYHMRWESINGPESWAANPWVWVVEFKVVKPCPAA